MSSVQIVLDTVMCLTEQHSLFHIVAGNGRLRSFALRDVPNVALDDLRIVDQVDIANELDLYVRPSAVSSGISSYRRYPRVCKSLKCSSFATRFLKSLISHTLLSQSTFFGMPRRFVKNGFASPMAPVSASRIGVRASIVGCVMPDVSG